MVVFIEMDEVNSFLGYLLHDGLFSAVGHYTNSHFEQFLCMLLFFPVA